MDLYDFLEEKVNLAKEILGKSGLEYVAENIQNISEWNMIGSSPQDIINLPMGVLRALNSREGCTALEQKRSRELLSLFYKRCISCFDEIWNPYQCLFWQDFYEWAEEDAIDKSLAKVLNKLRTISKYADYVKYKQYLHNRTLLSEYIELPVAPSKKTYKKMLEKAKYVLECVEHETVINKLFLEQAVKRAKFYAYEDEKYEVHMLKSLNDFLKESEYQKNCLWSFVELGCTGYTTVLALREKSKKEVPFVTIEVRGNPMECPELLQMKGRFNKEVSDEVKEWIFAYCEEHGIETFDWDDLDLTLF